MARYQYETSPRKYETEYGDKNKRLKVVKDNKEQKNLNNGKEQKHKKSRHVFLIVAIFATLLLISYRNSLINEKFKSIQKQEKELATIEKSNKQMEVSIESSLNLKTIEQIASEKLGMRKQSKDQTVYTNIQKEDYIESSIEEVKKEKQGFFESILSFIGLK